MSSPSASTAGRLRRWRLPVLLVVMLVVMALAQALTVALNDLGAVDLVAGVALSAAVLYCYVWLSQRVEHRRSIVELPRNRAVSGLSWGSLLGAGAFTTTMLIILAFGGWHVTGGDSWKFLATLGVMACTAVTEEVVFRGVVFRIAEERFGSWWALVISAVVFGLIHLAGAADASAGAMVWGAVAIILQGGLLLGAAYMATRALWLPIGIHFAWNVAEAGFGTAVSGKSSEFGGLIQTSLSGPTALTGGTFGPEAGLAGILTCLATAALLLRHAVRTDRIVRA
jgi:membrane protease YdiL (CAAX protease family)